MEKIKLIHGAYCFLLLTSLVGCSTKEKQLISHVNKLDFFIPIDDGALVQLIGQGERKKPKSSISGRQYSIITSNIDFCDLLVDIDFTIESYGMINYLLDYYNNEKVRYHSLISGLKQRNQTESAKYLEGGLKFYELHQKELANLNTNPDDFEEKHEALSNKLNLNYTLFSTLKDIAQDIKKHPYNYCVDLDGEPIDILFSGVVNKYLPNGKLYKKCTIVEGKAHGECITYFSTSGTKEKITIYENGKEKHDSKRWDVNGSLKYEKSEKIQKRYYPNGEVQSYTDFVNKIQGSFYENGQKRHETINYHNPDLKITKKWNADGKPINNK